MPFHFLNKSSEPSSSFDLPKHLQHKPVFAMPYEWLEGPGQSDTEFISVGFAQWDNETSDLSVKLMRHTGKRWSRQAEELPLSSSW